MADDWTAPGAFEVAPQVYRIPLPLPDDGLRAVNVYAVLSERGVDLIDPGWAIPAAREHLGAALASLDRTFADIEQCLVTHVHRDHYTHAAELRREFGIPLRLGRGERESLTLLQSERLPLIPLLALLERCGAGALAARLAPRLEGRQVHSPAEWSTPDTWLAPGEIVLGSGRAVQVIETPGHTRGHVVLHDPSAQLLFAGDHILPSITPSIGFEPAPAPDPLGAFLQSLAIVREMPDACLLPAHGPVTSSVHARVDELVEHHGRRLDASERAVALGATTVQEVAEQLRWTRREHSLDELDDFNRMLAVIETHAHLRLLVAQGRLTMHDDAEGIGRYCVGH